MGKKDKSLKSYLESVDDEFILDTLGQIIRNRLNGMIMTYNLLEDEFDAIAIKDHKITEFIKESREEFDNSTRDIIEIVEFLHIYANANRLKDKDD